MITRHRFDLLDLIVNPELMILNKSFVQHNYELRIVGGAVRDLLLGQVPADVDLCTNATPEEMIKLARDEHLAAIDTGSQHGTYTFVVNHVPFEVTTLRIDTETNGRHAKVEWTRDFYVDAQRRDFTINAMSLDFNGDLYDYFGGQKDLADNKICFVGSALQRVQEDYLRILRYFRFASRFNTKMDPNTIKIFSDQEILKGLSKISIERIWNEMKRLLVGPGRESVIQAMYSCGVAQTTGLHTSPCMTLLGRSNDEITALCAFVSCSTALSLADKWKLSTEERNKLLFLSTTPYPTSVIEVENLLVGGKPRDWVEGLCLLAGRRDLKDTTNKFDIPTFPIRGDDLLAREYKRGPEIGVALKKLKDIWIDSRFKLSKEDLLQYL